MLLGYVHPIHIVLYAQGNNFGGELIDVSAKTKALLGSKETVFKCNNTLFRLFWDNINIFFV